MGQSKPIAKGMGIPAGMHTVTPSLVLRDCARAITFYQHAFGATEVRRMTSPDGHSIWHAELRIGDSTLFLNDEMPGQVAPTLEHPAAMSIQLYVGDCDEVFARALASGARSTMKPDDMFWGDRMGSVVDPYGYPWAIATHQRDVPEAELTRAMQAAQQRLERGAEPGDSGTWRTAEDEERDAMR